MSNWMDLLKQKGQEDYDKHFRKWDECLKNFKVNSLEELYKGIHDKIRSDPKFERKQPPENPVHVREGELIKTS